MDQCDEIFNVMKLDWSFLVSSSGSYLADPKITQSGRQVGLGILFYKIQHSIIYQQPYFMGVKSFNQ